MKDISIVIPGIRTKNWVQVHETVKESCKRHSFEIIFAGPFDPPAELAGVDNIKFIRTYRSPSAAAQLAASQCDARLLLHSVDDSKWVPDATDAAVDLYNTKNPKDIINLRYTEFDDYTGKTFPMEYWTVAYHSALHQPGIPRHFKISLHFLMDYRYFVDLGGFDCAYEYQNFNLHDLMFRAQQEGSVIWDSATDVTNCNHYCNRAVDHGPIEDAWVVDFEMFKAKYRNFNALQNTKIPFDNWKNTPEVWSRRFTKMFTSYEEMVGG